MNNDTQNNKAKILPVLIGKLMLTVAALAAIFFVGSLVSLILMSEDIHLIITYIICYLLPLLFVPVIWMKKKRKYLKICLMIAVLGFVVLGVDFTVIKHNKAITVDTSGYCEEQAYLPFREDSEAVNIKSKTLKLTDNFPLIDGTEAVLPMYSAFINAVYPETQTPYGDYMHCNDQYGYEYLADKETDIFIDLFCSEEQKSQAEAFDSAFEFTELGSDAFVFFVHKDNPVDNLSSEQLRGIYSGEITNWAELGGKIKAIKAYQNETDSISQDMMERFMGETALMAAPSEMGYSYLFAWENQLSLYKNKSDSIGYSFRHCVENNPDIKMLSVDGLAPTKENISSAAYPFVVPILAVNHVENTNENVDILLEWIMSDEGQYILEESGFVGLIDEP